MLHEELEIGSDPSEVARARRWARVRLARAGVDVHEPLAETLVLLVSELVTNAVVHAACPALLSFRSGTASGEAVRLEVADGSNLPPRQRQVDDEETSGRGLELVAALADRWGWEPRGAGKRVWCEVTRRAGGGASMSPPGLARVDAPDTEGLLVQ